MSTYSTLEVRTGPAPATQPLAVPLVLKPYQHENEQFGYSARLSAGQSGVLRSGESPVHRTGDGIATVSRTGSWMTTDLRSAVRPADGGGERRPIGSGWHEDRFRFGRAGCTSWPRRDGKPPCCTRSMAAGRSPPGRFPAAKADPCRMISSSSPDRTTSRKPGRPPILLSRGRSRSGKGPPPIVRFALTGSDPKLFWRRLHDLELFVPQFVDDRLVMGEPILISRKCIGLASHSGIPSSVVSRAGKVHVVWAEATEPDEKVPGVPTFVATYDRATGQLSQPALVGYGAPPNDIHNSPSITMDSQGYLHVLAGTHGKPFQYARSLQPNDASGGWTEAEPVGKDLPQTYIGLVCGPDDTLHLTYRLWRYGDPPHPLSHHATLAYQRKRPGQPWEAPRILIVPPFSEYSVYYHRLTIDPQGRLFLSYDYWSTYWFYRNDQSGAPPQLADQPRRRPDVAAHNKPRLGG